MRRKSGAVTKLSNLADHSVVEKKPTSDFDDDSDSDEDQDHVSDLRPPFQGNRSVDDASDESQHLASIGEHSDRDNESEQMSLLDLYD